MTDLTKFIRAVPDFPKPGIKYYDITTLLLNPEGFKATIDRMETYLRSVNADVIIAIESRGFLFGAVLAERLGIGVILARKPGKLPAATVSAEYELEYGTDRLEVHVDAITENQRVVIVDDLIATGGTIAAVASLVEQQGAIVAGISAVIELSFLPWREKLSAWDVNHLISYDSE